MSDSHWLNDLPFAPRERVKIILIALGRDRDRRRTLGGKVKFQNGHNRPENPIEAQAAEGLHNLIRAFLNGLGPESAYTEASAFAGDALDKGSTMTEIGKVCEVIDQAVNTIRDAASLEATRFGIGDVVVCYIEGEGFGAGLVEGSHNGAACWIRMPREKKAREVSPGKVEAIVQAYAHAGSRDRWLGCFEALEQGERFKSAAAVIQILEPLTQRLAANNSEKKGRAKAA